MPSSSSRLTSDASEKRGGGWVKCCSAVTSRLAGTSPSRSRGKRRPSSSSLVVGAFLVEREIAGEDHHLPGRAQPVPAGAVGRSIVVRSIRALRHLARHRALPDQVVEPAMVARPGVVLGEIGRADRLVRFLRVLGLGLVHPRLVGDVARVVAVGDRVPRGGNRAAVHLHAVGAHVGDRAVLVEALRDAHRVAGGEAELARRFLLQRRGGERRRRVARRGLGLDRLDGEAAVLDIGLGLERIALVRRSSGGRSCRRST